MELVATIKVTFDYALLHITYKAILANFTITYFSFLIFYSLVLNIKIAVFIEF